MTRGSESPRLVRCFRASLPYWVAEVAIRARRDFFGRLPGCDRSYWIASGTHGAYDMYCRSSELSRTRRDGYEMLVRPRFLEGLRARAMRAAAAPGLAAELVRTATRDAGALADAFDEVVRLGTWLTAVYEATSPALSEAWWHRTIQWLSRRVYAPLDIYNSLVAHDVTTLAWYGERLHWVQMIEASGFRPRAIPDAAIATHAQHYGYLLPTEVWRDSVSDGARNDAVIAWLRRELSRVTAADVMALQRRLELARSRGRIAADVASDSARILHVPAVTLLACRTIAEVSWQRLRLKELWRQLSWTFTPLHLAWKRVLDEAVGRPLPESLKAQMAISDVTRLLRLGQAPRISQLRRRRSMALITLSRGVITTVDGDDGEAGVPLATRRLSPLLGELRGMVACGEEDVAGQAVRIEPDREPPRSAVADKIVVTTMLKPHTVAQCLSARAIVTEEGGVTSHAAVLARELGIPCMIGVQDATRRIEAGSFVRLNMSRGSISVSERPPDVQTRRLDGADRLRRRYVRLEARLQVRRHGESPLVVPLTTDVPLDPADVGQKACRLARYSEHTPPGFIMSAPVVATLCSALTGSHDRRRCHVDMALIRRDIRRCLAMLGAAHVAVRSSHCFEDGATASYAGLFRTVLDVRATVAEVCHAAAAVVASTSHPAVSSYARSPESHVGAMAVIVQRMISPRLAGVAMTDVVRRGRSYLVIEYTLGALNTLVDGTTSPSRVSMRRTARNGFDAKSLVPSDLARATGAPIMAALLQMFRRLEVDAGAPQEIEWAVDNNDRIWLLQTRPLVHTGRRATSGMLAGSSRSSPE